MATFATRKDQERSAKRHRTVEGHSLNDLLRNNKRCGTPII